MIKDDQSEADPGTTKSVPPQKSKPEETGHAPIGTDEAVEPEAAHTLTDAAIKTGDRMWGPPGPPEDRS